MEQVTLRSLRATFRMPPIPKLQVRPVHRLPKTCANQGAILSTAECSVLGLDVANSASRLTISDKKSDIDKSHLYHLYKQYSLLESTFDSCSSPDWKLKLADADDKAELRTMTIARNELENELFGESTSRCNTFKQRLVKRSTQYVPGSQSLALLFEASAVVTGSEQIAKSLAAAAGASTAFSGLVEEQFTNNNDVTISGIELARTRKFKQIIESRNDTAIAYPVSRAANDDLRYHSVRSLVEGITESEAAVESAIDDENQ